MSFRLSKPPGKMLLLDLVNLEVLRANLAFGSVYAAPFLAVHSGFPVPDLLGPALLQVTPLFGSAMIILLAASAVLQYLHLRLRTASPFGASVMDGAVVTGLRVLVVVANVAERAVRMCRSPELLRSTLDPWAKNYDRAAFSSMMRTYFAGLLLSFGARGSVTVVFKALSHRQRRRWELRPAAAAAASVGVAVAGPPPPQQQPRTLAKAYLLLLFLCLAGAGSAAYYRSLSSSSSFGLSVLVRVYLSLPVTCVLLPSLFVLSAERRGLAAHLKKVSRKWRKFMGGRRPYWHRIHPAE